jgi:hypothetical protein
MPKSTIAAYCFLTSCYYYWDARTQGFYLLEVAPGNLVRVDQTPIPLSRMEAHR